MSKEVRATGGCLCGAVRYQVHGQLRPVVYCHCSQCRKTSGNFVGATACKAEHLLMLADETLCWYDSSDEADRGFCARCGSNLFYRPAHGRHVAIFAGTIDLPTGLKAARHIFVDSAADYITLGDGLPQHHGWPAKELWDLSE